MIFTLEFHRRANPRYASDTNYNVTVPYLDAGYSVRASYVLIDYDYSYNSYQTSIKAVETDIWFILPGVGHYPGIAIKNQVEYEEDPEVCAPMSAPCHIWWYPTFLEYRGVCPGGVEVSCLPIMPIRKIPRVTCYQGVLRNCMSGVQTLRAADSVGKARALKKDSADDTAKRILHICCPLHRSKDAYPLTNK